MCEKSKNIITCIQNNNISFEILSCFFCLFLFKEINLPSNKIKPFRKGSKINVCPVKFVLYNRLILECDSSETVESLVGST